MDEKKWFKVSKRVSLLMNKDKVDPAFVPKEIVFEDNKKILEQVAVALSYSRPVLLIGETGTGKTSLVRHLAFCTNNAFVRVNHNGGTTIEDIVGRWLLTPTANGTVKTEWVDGILIEAMKKGYWFLADEINAAGAEINFVYHSLLDDDGRVILAEKGNEVVIPHPNFRFIGAMNPPTEYAGTKELNKALMSRFMICKIDFPAPKIEQKILVSRAGVTEEVAERMVRFAGEVRTMYRKDDIHFILSTRDLLMWAEMFKVYKKYLPSAEMTVLNKISEDDIEAVKTLMALHFKAVDDSVKAPTGAFVKDDED